MIPVDLQEHYILNNTGFFISAYMKSRGEGG
jgi:hypothetical protein